MISRSSFDAYAAMVDAQADSALARIRQFAGALDWGTTRAQRADARDMLRDFAYDVVTSYGDNAAAIAANYYDSLAALAGRDLPNAIMADSPQRAAVDGAVDWSTKSVWDSDAEGAMAAVDAAMVGTTVANVVASRVHSMANATMYNNAMRDGVRYARVPTSATPCAFCLMLASRGFEYLSEDTALYAHHMGRYHDDCRCKAVASFDDEGLEGYQDSADAYYGQWKAASDSLPDKVTREAWKAMGKAEQAKWTRQDHPTWNGYANYRTHMLLARLREQQGLDG